MGKCRLNWDCVGLEEKETCGRYLGLKKDVVHVIHHIMLSFHSNRSMILVSLENNSTQYDTLYGVTINHLPSILVPDIFSIDPNTSSSSYIQVHRKE